MGTAELAKCHYLRLDDDVLELAEEARRLAAANDKAQLSDIQEKLTVVMFSRIGLTGLDISRFSRSTVRSRVSARATADNGELWKFASLPSDVDDGADGYETGKWCSAASSYHSLLTKFAPDANENPVLFLSPREDELAGGILERAGIGRLFGRGLDPLGELGVAWCLDDDMKLIADAAASSPEIAEVFIHGNDVREACLMRESVPFYSAKQLDVLSFGHADSAEIYACRDIAMGFSPKLNEMLDVEVANASTPQIERMVRARREARAFSDLWYRGLMENVGGCVSYRGRGEQGGLDAGILAEIGRLYGLDEQAEETAAKLASDPGWQPWRAEEETKSEPDPDILEACQRASARGVRILSAAAITGLNADYDVLHTPAEQVALFAGTVKKRLGVECPLRFAFAGTDGSRDTYKLGRELLVGGGRLELLILVDECQVGICERLGYETVSLPFPGVEFSFRDMGARLVVNEPSALSPRGQRVVTGKLVERLVERQVLALPRDRGRKRRVRFNRVSDDALLGWLTAPKGAWDGDLEPYERIIDNIACDELECELERRYGSFYRQAAEVVGIWEDAYEAIGLEIASHTGLFAPKKTKELAHMLGVDSALESWAAGVPFEDLVSG